MIYLTGDIHGFIDIKKLNTSNFPEQKKLSKNDYVIILGDFGLIWNGGNTDKYWQDWLGSKSFTTLWIDGNHENFDLIETYPVECWNGGNIQKINDSIIHLMRGQVYSIGGYKIFTMGGATSIDKQFRKEGKSWWPQEIPSDAELSEGLKNLANVNWQVDYVLTHTASTKAMSAMYYIKEYSVLTEYFDMLEGRVTFSHWYFGHFHEDLSVTNKHTAVYDRIIPLGNG